MAQARPPCSESRAIGSEASLALAGVVVLTANSGRAETNPLMKHDWHAAAGFDRQSEDDNELIFGVALKNLVHRLQESSWRSLRNDPTPLARSLAHSLAKANCCPGNASQVLTRTI